MTAKLAVVFGGSGFVGRQTVRGLCKAGWRVRVPMRRPHLGVDLRVMGDVGQVQLAKANLRDAASIASAVEGAEAVVNLVGLLFEKGRQNFAALHVEGAGEIARASAAAGARAMVQMSALGADPNAKSAYARTKAAGEAAVRAAFPSAVILRPSIIFGPEDNFFNQFAEMARFSPFLPAIGGGVSRFQPIYVGDVAQAIRAALELGPSAKRIYELGGPRVYRFDELMRFILREIDRPRFLAPMPFAIAGLLGAAMDGAARLVPGLAPPLTGDQVALLRKDNVVAPASAEIGLLSDLGIARPETVEAIVPAYLAKYRPQGQFHERKTGES